MAITFDTLRKHIVLDSASVTDAEVWSRWCDWHAGNTRWPIAFVQEGGSLVDPTLGIYSPKYFFLENGWRIRPMESNHNLNLIGNFSVRGGGVPVVQTLGTYQVNVNYTVPVQAQGISTSGSTGPTAAEIAAEILAQATITPIYADNRFINGAPVIGDGTAGNDWRGLGVPPTIV